MLQMEVFGYLKNKMVRIMNKSIVILPHFDDEIFQTGAFLLKYKEEIELFITHPNDTISNSLYNLQKKMFIKTISLINEFRLKNNLKKIKTYIYNYSNFNGYIKTNNRKKIQKDLENVMSKENIDYFITTVKSTHQSHKICNEIAISCLRSPYIEKINNILLATYPQDEYGISFTDKKINAYIQLEKQEVEFLCYCIKEIYGIKNNNKKILNSDSFYKYLSYFGIKSGNEFAMPFYILKTVLM